MRKRKELQEILDEVAKAFKSGSDPNGCYTGHPADNGKPVQDADDL